jgi:hypothetical protein
MPIHAGGDRMAEPKSDASKTGPSSNADVVTTRVNIAFPFSQIKVQAPSEELVELAALVGEMAHLLADVAPGSKAQEFGERAQAFVTRLK